MNHPVPTPVYSKAGMGQKAGGPFCPAALVRLTPLSHVYAMCDLLDIYVKSSAWDVALWRHLHTQAKFVHCNWMSWANA